MSFFRQYFQTGFPDARWAFPVGLGILVYLGWTINDFGLGHDETWTIYYGSPALSLTELFRTRLIVEPHPPLFYILAHFWMSVFGASEDGVRSFSLLSLVVMLGIFWWTWRRDILGAAAAPFFLIILTSWSVWWSVNQGRMYGWLIAVGVLLTVLCVKSIQDHRSGRSPAPAVMVCIFGAALFAGFLHYFGTLFAGSTILVLFAYFSWHKDLRTAGAFFVIGVSILVLFGAWIWFAIPDLSLRLGGEFWIPFQPFKQTLLFLERGLSDNPVLMVMLAVCLLAGFRPIKNDPSALVLLCITALGYALALLISLHTPLIFWKYLFPFIPPLAYVTGRAVARVSRDNFPSWMWLAIFALSIGLNVQNFPKPLENYRDSANYIRSHWAEECQGAPVVALPTPASYSKANIWPHSFYLQDLNLRFLKISDENLRQAQAHACPLAVYIGRKYPKHLPKYLSGLGIDASKFEIVSFGRTHLLYTAGRDMKQNPSSP